MVTASLALPETEYRRIMAHLLPDRPRREEAAFIFARGDRTEKAALFWLLEWWPISTADLECHEADYLELNNETRAQLIKRAHDLGASIVEFHSHIGPWPAAFSLADRKGLEEFVPHVWWRLKGAPYMAFVVTRSGFDGLVWLESPTKPRSVGGIIAGDRVLEPTRLTLAHWERSDVRPF